MLPGLSQQKRAEVKLWVFPPLVCARMKLCTFTTSSSIHTLEERVDEHVCALQVTATATAYRSQLTDVMIVVAHS